MSSFKGQFSRSLNLREWFLPEKTLAGWFDSTFVEGTYVALTWVELEAPVVQPASTGYAKVYVSGSWQLKPVKVWNGASWVTKPVKTWGGSSWVMH